MGGVFSHTSAEIPRDARVDRWVSKLNITDDKLHIFYARFTKYDKEGSGRIAVEDYIGKILQITRSILVEALFDLIGIKDPSWLSFGEYVDITCTIACFEVVDMIRYCFFVLDREKVGYVDKNEIKHFVKNIWEDHVTSNMQLGLNYLDKVDTGDGKCSFEDMLEYHHLYPSTFYPAFRLQVAIMQTSLGEIWWTLKKTELQDKALDREAEERAREKKRRDEMAQAEELSNEEMVLNRMGPIRYYLCPCQRAEERNKIARIAAITAELNID